MIRKDLPDIVRQIKGCSMFIFTSMVTKGDFLNEEKTEELFDAGMDQIAVSLDFPGKNMIPTEAFPVSGRNSQKPFPN